MAPRAVRRYLADYHGDELQEQWRRVWDGYVAFREAGSLGADLRRKLRPETAVQPLAAPQDIEARVIEMIERKKRYGSLNHGPDTVMPSGLFDAPKHLLEALKKLEKDGRPLIVPGKPDKSQLLDLFEIDGPMYKVFTDEEKTLWRDWIAWLSFGNVVCPAVPPTGGTAGPTGGGGGGPAEGGDVGPTAAVAGDPRDGADGGDSLRHYKRLFLSSPVEAFRADPQRTLRGRGAVQ